jgi:hypothetical protein
MRYNVIVALLSVIATLLAVLAFKPAPSASGQASVGGNATVGGEIAVATGNILGGSGSAFWLFYRPEKKLAVYFLGNRGLELRAVRDVQYDLQLVDTGTSLTPGKMTSVAKVKAEVTKK